MIIALGAVAWWNQVWLKEEIYVLRNATPLVASTVGALKPGDLFKECGVARKWSSWRGRRSRWVRRMAKANRPSIRGTM